MKRYFLVCYKGQYPVGSEYFMGILTIIQHDGKYINRIVVTDEIIKLHMGARRQNIMLTNIIELSENDFKTFIENE